MGMFVWAMRNKGSEWRAMKSFLQAGALPFTPLIEAVCEPFMAQRGSVPENPVAAMEKLGRRIAPLTDSGRVWVDLGHLERIFSSNDVVEMMRVVRKHSQLAHHLVVPVIRTSMRQPVMDEAIEWARSEGSGLCIRVDGLTGLRDKARLLSDIVAESRLPHDAIDLVLDAQDLPLAVSHDEMRDAFQLTHSARTWVVLAGSFPTSVTDMRPDDYEHRRDRGEWTAWRDEIELPGEGRRPVFGDYATQPAVYNPSPSFPGSPTVRYSAAEEYIILRGRGGYGSVSADYSQFIGHARFLRQQPYYCTVTHSIGDDYVERIASSGIQTGNLTTWRVASLQRHVSVVAAQVAAFAPVFVGEQSSGRRLL
jgi:hypothetical protein